MIEPPRTPEELLREALARKEKRDCFGKCICSNYTCQSCSIRGSCYTKSQRSPGMDFIRDYIR